jgi:PBP1b-binding outer membrane lipoprotein LpoB
LIFTAYLNLPMKRISILLLAAVILSGCKDKKAEVKLILSDVLKVHEKVMSDDEQLTKNKMQLDTIIKENKLPKLDSAKILSVKLVTADSLMDKWMHDFDPDQTAKSTDDAIAYMNKQKKQIMAIDSQLSLAVKESSQYLLKVKSK